MANVFEKAKPKPAAAKVKEETIWRIEDDGPHADVAQAIYDIHILNAKAKPLKAKLTEIEENLAGPKKAVLDYASGLYAEALATRPGRPATPMRVQNDREASVTYVLQDKSTGVALSAQQLEDLAKIVGQDELDGAIERFKVIAFNPEVLAQPAANKRGPKSTVQQVVAEALTAALNGLVAKGVLTTAQVDELLIVEEKTVLRPGLLERLGQLCGGSRIRIQAVIEGLPQAFVRYILAK